MINETKGNVSFLSFFIPYLMLIIYFEIDKNKNKISYLFYRSEY